MFLGHRRLDLRLVDLDAEQQSEQSQKRLTDLCRSKGIYLKRFVVNLQDVNIEQGPS